MSQFYERNDATGQFGFRQFHEVFQSDGVSDIKLSGGCAVQGAQVRAATELLAEIMCQASYVGALGTMHPEDADRVSVVFELCLLYTSPSPRDKRQSRMPSSA